MTHLYQQYQRCFFAREHLSEAEKMAEKKSN